MNNFSSFTESTEKMPVLFLGHGSPMNAIEDNIYTRSWHNVTKDIPKPRGILIISAHWETKGDTKIYTGNKPKMIYDMYGFPKDLYEVDYPASGFPEMAEEVVKNAKIAPTHDWGLDHGAWSVLVKMYPEADIPCFQMSLNSTRDLQWHFDLAKELSFLRRKGILIVGSGNIVHNLRYAMYFNQKAPEWAVNFDQYVADRINNRDFQSLINYKKQGQDALISVNSAEHYIPMLYALALKEKDDEVSYFNENKGDTLMDYFMRCLRIG